MFNTDESSGDIAVIAGAAAGGVIVLLLLLILIVFCMRKRKKGTGMSLFLYVLQQKGCWLSVFRPCVRQDRKENWKWDRN